TRPRGRRRNDMVVETAMLVPRDDQEALLPDGRVSDRLVGGFDETLARGDAGERVLRVPVPEVVEDVITRLDEDIGGVERRVLQMFRELLEFLDVEHDANAVELGDIREVIVRVDPVLHALLLEKVEHRPLLELKPSAGSADRDRNFLLRRGIVEMAAG